MRGRGRRGREDSRLITVVRMPHIVAKFSFSSTDADVEHTCLDAIGYSAQTTPESR